jgi:hypothetical protein
MAGQRGSPHASNGDRRRYERSPRMPETGDGEANPPLAIVQIGI